MKKTFIIYLSIVLCAVMCSFKSQAQPPLKREFLPDADVWSADSIRSELLDFFIPGLDEPVEEDDDNLAIAEAISDFASRFLGRKYVWGATGPKSFDCSGFTSYIFRHAGIELPRTSRMQYALGEKVRREELQPGDLLFFSSPRTRRGVVGHVAMVVDVAEDGKSCTFIHASTTKGISYQKFPDDGYYSRRYIGAKRVIS